jgi:3-deoxy-D-manno-octulosonate 8-phosphate phosphatase (KDO 8-P phosphatase)
MVRGLIFDWDGVWTDGRKRPDGHSEFSEHDTMGLNLLRFGHYLHTGEMLRVALVTGERNLTAEHVAQREHIDQFLFYARDKTKAIPLLTERWSQSPSDWAFVFDDVLDFGLAAQVGRRAMVAWPWTEGVRELAQKHKLVNDWIPTPSPVRRWCEHYLAERGWLEAAVAGRQAWSETYQAYWSLRNAIDPEVLDLSR